MARLPRYYIKNQPQYIIQRSIKSRDIFIRDEDYLIYYEWLQSAAYLNKLKVHSYIFMPGQVHLLATPGNENSISKTLQSLSRSYVQHYNKSYNVSGTLWEGRYRATILDSREYLLICSRHIETNSVRNGLADHPRDYYWSSYACNAGNEEDPLITQHRVYRALGKTDKERTKNYRAAFKKPIPDELASHIHDSTLKGWALGNEKFVAKIEKICNRRATPLPRGRPSLDGKT